MTSFESTFSNLKQCEWTCLCRFSLENFIHAPTSDICTRWKAGGHGIFMHSLMSPIRSSTRIRWIKLLILSLHVSLNWSLENLVHSTYQVCWWKAKCTPRITIPLVHEWRFKYLNQLFKMTGVGVKTLEGVVFICLFFIRHECNISCQKSMEEMNLCWVFFES